MTMITKEKDVRIGDEVEVNGVLYSIECIEHGSNEKQLSLVEVR